MTGMPMSTRRCTRSSCTPSIFTAWAPPSLIKRPAFRTPSSTEAWNDMNGMSPTTMACSAPRATAFTWWSISSIVTGSSFG